MDRIEPHDRQRDADDRTYTVTLKRGYGYRWEYVIECSAWKGRTVAPARSEDPALAMFEAAAHLLHWGQTPPNEFYDRTSQALVRITEGLDELRGGRRA